MEEARRAPVGVLVISGLLALSGAGLVLGALYLALGRALSWMPLVAGAVAGPLTLYVAINLLRGKRWSWLTVLLVLLLLLASSVARVTSAPGLVVVPFVEILVELIAIAYLTRPTVRRAFVRR